jgi:hypothetical protein
MESAMHRTVLGLLVVLFFGFASALSGTHLRWCLCEHVLVANGDCGCCCVGGGSPDSGACPDCGGGGGSDAPVPQGDEVVWTPAPECLVTLFDGDVGSQALLGGGAIAAPGVGLSPFPPGWPGSAGWPAALPGSPREPQWLCQGTRAPARLSGSDYVLRLRALRI